MRKQTFCDYEKRLAAVKADSLSDELKNHLKECADCRETQKIITFFQKIPAQEKSTINLPTAGFIWWKSQMQKKRAAAARAVQPIYIIQTAAAIPASALVVWLLISFSQFDFIGSAFAKILDSLGSIIIPLLLGAAGLAVVSAVLTFTLNRLYSRQ